ncbi:MAG: hypothetical protein GDA52_11025 [Rhodobacteraceae bacterium]|nr:hypothetical protein [Paracoccaceae bacterium]
MAAVIGAGAALVVKGADAVLARLFRYYDKRADNIDADLALAHRVIFEVRDLANDYWCQDRRDEKTEAALTGRLMFLGMVCEGLFKHKPVHHQAIKGQVNRLDEACTGGDFATNPRRAAPRRCSDIEIAAYRLAYESGKRHHKL